MHVYPAIDLRGGKCVRLVQGDYARETVFADDPVEVTREWVKQGATRLHLVDLDGAKAGRPVNGDVVRAIVVAAGVPCQFGGGVRTADDLAAVFAWGVRWAVLGTKAVEDPGWVRRAAADHPGRVVLGLDARDGMVATDGWLATSATSAVELALAVEDAPLYAVVYTDIARDGTMTGPNVSALADLIARTRLPVIASGGVATLDHARECARAGAHGAIIGRALYERAVTLPDLLALGATSPPGPGPS